MPARKRIPGWANLALLSLTALTFWDGGIEYLVLGYSALLAGVGLKADVLGIAEESLGHFLVGRLFGLPAAQALFQRTRSGWSWVEWTGIVLAASLMSIAIAQEFSTIATLTDSPVPELAADASALCLASALCVWLAWPTGKITTIRERAHASAPMTLYPH